MKTVNVFLTLLIAGLAALISLVAVGFAVFSAGQSNPYSWMGQMFTGTGARNGMMGGVTQTANSVFLPYFGVSFVLLIILVIVGAVGTVYFALYPPIKVDGAAAKIQSAQAQGSNAAFESVTKTLTEDERKIISALNVHGGKYLQKYLSKETGLSRLKTHRIIARLAQRGIVKLEKVGNTNQVYLAEWLKQENSASVALG
jgi:uncharacterized membrane protein